MFNLRPVYFPSISYFLEGFFVFVLFCFAFELSQKFRPKQGFINESPDVRRISILNRILSSKLNST